MSSSWVPSRVIFLQKESDQGGDSEEDEDHIGEEEKIVDKRVLREGEL